MKYFDVTTSPALLFDMELPLSQKLKVIETDRSRYEKYVEIQTI